MKFRARQFNYEFPRPALVMGIVNVTPDSFSDGGKFVDHEKAAAHALALEGQGADLIDVGGESTRPGASPVAVEEEMRRVLPVLERLSGRLRVPVSIDTMKPPVARRAIELGAAIVNDVGAARQGEEMWRCVAESGAGYVCMHMQGTPQTMQLNPTYSNVVAEVGTFFCERMDRLRDCGVQPEQIILDPGIGFGKTVEHNLGLLGQLGRFARLGRPLLIGVSRKGFIGKLTGAAPEQRLPGALACACLALAMGARIFRVHDVSETVQAVRMAEAILKATENA